jgi:cell division protein FtsB
MGTDLPQRTNHRRQRGGDFLAAATRVVLVLIGAAIVLTLAFTFYPEWSRLAAMKGDLRKKESALAELKKRTATHEQEVRLLQTDPQYLEIIAREKLDLMKDGETIFRLGNTQPRS